MTTNEKAAPPPAAARGDVRGLVGQLKHELAADKGWDYTEYEKGRIAEKERCIALLEALAAEGAQAGEVGK